MTKNQETETDYNRGYSDGKLDGATEQHKIDLETEIAVLRAIQHDLEVMTLRRAEDRIESDIQYLSGILKALKGA